MRIRTKRIYEAPADDDGLRVLVDRLWPRGISKTDCAVDLWLRELAPSDALRKWFAHDRARWDEFRRAYFEELHTSQAGVAVLHEAAASQTITLLFAARDPECNNAVALKFFLESNGGSIPAQIS